MTAEEHVHEVNLKVTRRDPDGMREFTADGPCLTCGQPIETHTVAESSIRYAPNSVQGTTAQPTQVSRITCKLPPDEPPLNIRG